LLLWAVDVLGGVDRAVEIRSSPAPPVSGVPTGPTFDGRDVFAPAAARLFQGASLRELGPELDPAGLVRLTAPRMVVSPGALEAEVVWVDGFGNVQLAADARDLASAALGTMLEVVANAVHRVRSVRAFAALASGELGLIIDANGRISVVCDRQSAATVLGVQPGDVVTVRTAAAGGGSP
jgi:hypothetical protein